MAAVRPAASSSRIDGLSEQRVTHWVARCSARWASIFPRANGQTDCPEGFHIGAGIYFAGVACLQPDNVEAHQVALGYRQGGLS
jgi:hypothetical protein